ncbi:MAG: Hsp70 family protein, partial [Hyphomicrobiaceae bacterium]
KNMNPPSWYYHDLSTWQRINVLYDNKVVSEIIGVRRDALEPEKLDRLLRVIELRKGHELLGQIEETKIALSSDLEVKLASVAFARGQQLKVTRAQFERAVADSMARVGRKIEETVASAGLKASDISTVFVTGGSSSIPILRKLIANALPSSRIVEGDAFGSVATGLAIDARRRFG